MREELDILVFKQNLKAFIEVNCLSAPGFAGMIGVHPSRVCRWLDIEDKSMPGQPELAAIAALTGIPAKELLFRKVHLFRKIPSYDLGLLCLFTNVHDTAGFRCFIDAFNAVAQATNKSAVTVRFGKNFYGVKCGTLCDHVAVKDDSHWFSIDIPVRMNRIEIPETEILSVTCDSRLYNYCFRFIVHLKDHTAFEMTFELGCPGDNRPLTGSEPAKG